ncbi:MAG: LAGLIDADG family homing endonuclease, partial [Methanomassiliicoccales archaeon]
MDATNSEDKNGMIKTASGHVLIEPGTDKAKIVAAEVKKHPTSLFFRAKAIKANEANSNGDFFSVDELLRSYKSFEGVPFFTNHDNQNIENARGKIIFAEWVPAEKAVYTIGFVDREAFPHICRSIEEEYVTGVSMGAINGESLIVMADLTEKKISEINEGEYILSAYGNVKKVKKVHSEYLGKQMYSFDVSTYHKTPMFTNDHPVFMIEKSVVEANKREAIRVCSNSRYEKRMGRIEESIGQDIWRTKDYASDAKFTEANKIQNGDFLLAPSKFKIEDGASLNSDFYYVVGAYLGDGYLKKDKNGKYEGISFCIGLNEIELAKKITTILKKYSKSEPHDLVCENRNGLYISLYDRELAQWFAKNIGTGSKTKRLQCNLRFKEDALNLLAGYLDTDGCIAKKTNANHTASYQFSSANIGLLEDIQSLLISLSCVSSIHSFNRTPSKNSVVKVNTIEHTLAVGSNHSNLFGYSIKFNLNDCCGAKINAGKTFIVNVNGNNFMACPVKEIHIEDFSEPVYDITVEGDECYIADGIAIHNCSVEYSVCSICGNRAEKTDDYCTHIKNRKGRKFTGRAKNVVTGEVKDFNNAQVFEYNYGIKFIELSAVVDPACASCHIQGIIPNGDYLSRVAHVQNGLYMLKSSA